MKRVIILIILVSICLVSCLSKLNKEKKVVIKSNLYRASKTFFVDTIFNLNNYKTIEEFQKTRYKVDKFGKYSVVSLEIEKVNYIFNLESVPSNCFLFYPLKMKNTLFIYRDSIVKPCFKNKSINYPIDSIYFLYKKDISNNKREVNFSDSPNHLVLSFQLDDSTSIKTTKELLNRVVKAYLKMNKDSLPLNLSISYKAPPPPPRN